MRSFPSAARQRLTASCVGLALLAAAAVPFAHADEDDLRSRQRDVRGQITDAADDLKEASRMVTRATARLERTQAELSAARSTLSDVRRRLADARERDARLKTELAGAEQELQRATAAMEAAALAVEDQRDAVRRTAISIYTGGDPRLQALGTLLESGSLEEIAARRLGNEFVTTRQSTVFEDLEEAEAALVADQAEVERTTLAVEAKRIEAAEHLEDVKGLYTESVTAAARVRGLVGQARTARQQAYAARARDRRTLQALRARETAIQKRLVEIARLQRLQNQRGFNGRSDGYLSNPSRGYVTSPYGYRTHPIYGYYSLHNGIDYGTGCGGALFASAGGTVIDTYYDSVYGNRLFLSLGQVNGKSLVLIYNHMASYRVSEGARIPRGTVVGLSGNTGWSTGCHLHFTVMEDGVAVDPMKYL